MLLKIHDLFKISLNICEIHLNRFWLQIINIFREMWHQTLIWHAFLCTKVSFFEIKRLAFFLLLKIFAARKISETFYINMKKWGKSGKFLSTFKIIFKLLKMTILQGKMQKKSSFISRHCTFYINLILTE